MGRKDRFLVDDPEKARRSREKIAKGEQLVYWHWLEAILRSCPSNRELPSYIPTGQLPTVRRKR